MRAAQGCRCGSRPKWCRVAGDRAPAWPPGALEAAGGAQGAGVGWRWARRRRRDSAPAIGAAVLARCGVELPPDAPLLYAGVPGRTVRSWRRRFSDQADELSTRFMALCGEWRGELPWAMPADSPSLTAVAIGAAWRARRRRARYGLPGAWLMANAVLGGKILSTRVDLPWPIRRAWIARSRGP